MKQTLVSIIALFMVSCYTLPAQAASVELVYLIKNDRGVYLCEQPSSPLVGCSLITKIEAPTTCQVVNPQAGYVDCKGI